VVLAQKIEDVLPLAAAILHPLPGISLGSWTDQKRRDYGQQPSEQARAML
jgi:hypothetical protein